MNHPYFIELKKYSLDEILIKLGKDVSNDNKKSLKNLLKPLKYVTLNEDDTFSFEYVGILVLDDFVFRFLPKYINEDSNEKELKNKFKKVLKVIRKASKKNPHLLRYGTFEESYYNFLQLSISLFEDYHHYGLYFNDLECLEENGDGEVAWDETILYKLPIQINRFHIYDPVITWDTVKNDTDLIQDIHKTVLSECSERLKRNDLLDIFDIKPIFLSNKNIEDLEEPKYLVEILQKELAQQFVTQKQNVIKMLIKYIENEYLENNKNKKGLKGYFSYSYYGINLFHSIWEEVCRDVFKGDPTRKISSLPYSQEFKKTKFYQQKISTCEYELKDIINKPIWIKENTDTDGNKIRVRSETFRLDAICIYKQTNNHFSNNAENYVFAILDAKYYDFDIKEKSDDKQKSNVTNNNYAIKGKHPGIEDIAKQFLYQQAYNKFIKKCGYQEIYNVFICPTEKETHRFGKIKFNLIQSMLQSEELNDIQIVKTNADNLFDLYLANKKIEDPGLYLKLTK